MRSRAAYRTALESPETEFSKVRPNNEVQGIVKKPRLLRDRRKNRDSLPARERANVVVRYCCVKFIAQRQTLEGFFYPSA